MGAHSRGSSPGQSLFKAETWGMCVSKGGTGLVGRLERWEWEGRVFQVKGIVYVKAQIWGEPGTGDKSKCSCV